jgi:hypothetical protein
MLPPVPAGGVTPLPPAPLAPVPVALEEDEVELGEVLPCRPLG